MEAFKGIKIIYRYLFIELADSRTNNWFMVQNPFPVFILVIIYNFFVLGVGPKLMRYRKPFQLKNTLAVYNFLQVLLSTYLFLEAFTGAYWKKYSWKCEAIDFSRSEDAMRAARGCHVYYMAKISELLDSVFFVLRKKDNQLTLLHIYHHSIMPLISWGHVKYVPGGHSVFIGMINSFVHIIMYTYYMISTMGIKYQKYIWWKRQLTRLQMVQMGVTFCHSAQLIFYDCGYPKWTIIFTMPNAILLSWLFYDFYQNVYVDEVKVPEDKTTIMSSNQCYKPNISTSHDRQNGEVLKKQM